MTAATTFTDAELVERLSLITTKMDSVRHRIAATGQLTVSEAAQLAIAIEEITGDIYVLADRLGAAADGRGRLRAHARLIRRKRRQDR
jgi:hypothetical protein